MKIKDIVVLKDQHAVETGKLNATIKKNKVEHKEKTDELEGVIEEVKVELKDETDVRDKKIAELQESLRKANDEIRDLKVKLRIPRMHLHHLDKQGKLEEFVQAQLLGKTAEAKWLLQRAAEKELDAIEEEHRVDALKNEKELRRVKMLKMFGQLKRARAESADKANRAKPTLLGKTDKQAN